MDNNNSSCYNCKHFLQYYIRENGGFQAIDYGHCRRRALTCKECIGFPYAEGCEYWEKITEILQRKK